jgi:hypothetical protein
MMKALFLVAVTLMIGGCASKACLCTTKPTTLVNEPIDATFPATSGGPQIYVINLPHGFDLEKIAYVQVNLNTSWVRGVLKNGVKTCDELQVMHEDGKDPIIEFKPMFFNVLDAHSPDLVTEGHATGQGDTFEFSPGNNAFDDIAFTVSRGRIWIRLREKAVPKFQVGMVHSAAVIIKVRP